MMRPLQDRLWEFTFRHLERIIGGKENALALSFLFGFLFLCWLYLRMFEGVLQQKTAFACFLFLCAVLLLFFINYCKRITKAQDKLTVSLCCIPTLFGPFFVSFDNSGLNERILQIFDLIVSMLALALFVWILILVVKQESRSWTGVPSWLLIAIAVVATIKPLQTFICGNQRTAGLLPVIMHSVGAIPLCVRIFYPLNLRPSDRPMAEDGEDPQQQRDTASLDSNDTDGPARSDTVLHRRIKSSKSSLPAQEESQGDLNVYDFAAKIKREAHRLGGFWDGWTKIPVDVVEEVCRLGADSDTFASRLGVPKEALLGRPKPDTDIKAIRNILEIWMCRKGSNATLEVLFTSLHRMNLLSKLQAKLN